MKKVLKLLSIVCSIGFFVSSLTAQNVAKEEVVKLVEQTVTDIAKDAKGTFAKIAKKEELYVNKADPSFYVFVYDVDINMIAHPDAALVGKNFKGKPDPKNFKFRDEIVKLAKADAIGEVNYMYKKPGDEGLFEKTTYFKKVKGSDGVEYIVCSGRYADKKK